MIRKKLRKIFEQLLLNVKKEKRYPVYVSKRNSSLGKKVILLMIPNGEEIDYLAVKKLSALLREIMSKHQGDFL